MIVKVIKNTYTAEPLYQWDLNQVLRVYGLSLARVPEVHFTNQALGRAIVRQARMDARGVITVDVPNSLLQKPYTITAFICGYNGTTFETYHKLDIPVKKRPKPADYTLTNDPEVYSFKALENAVANAQNDMNTATASLRSAENTLKETTATIDSKVDNSVQAALPGFLDDTLTDPNKAAQAATVAAAIAAGLDTRAQVVVGSYTGLGRYGEDSPNTLTLPFRPKMVIIDKSFYCPNGAPGYFSVSSGFSILYGSGENFTIFLYNGDVRMASSLKEVSVTDNGISWYHKKGTIGSGGGLIFDQSLDNGAAVQLDAAGTEYTYVAIG